VHAKAGKTTICHRTGSATNPFVLITVSNNALPAHMRHGDLLPGPSGTCVDATQPIPASTGANQVAGASQGSGAGAGSGSGSGSGDPPTTPASVAQQATSDDSGDSLPFTGADLLVLAGIGVAALGAGVALRRLRAPGA
jgi:hypothetical protein